MEKQKRYVALDYGTGSGVAMCGAFDGARLAVETLHRFPVLSTPMLGTIYWDFPAMIRNARTALSRYSAKHGYSLAGIACDGWGCDFGLLDKTGHLLANPVSHADSRTSGAPERMFQVIPERSLYQRTGILSRREVTLFQLYSMALANSPLLDKAVTMLMIPDLVSYFLSGAPVQEYTVATTTGMYDAESMDWSRDIILSAKIPPGMMPEIVAPGTVIGPILDAVAAGCGLGPTPVIAPASHAFAGAVAAVPAEGEDWLYVVSGDWDQVGVEVSSPLINDAAFSAGLTNEGGVDGTTRLLRGAMGFHVLAECVRAWSREDGHELDTASILDLVDGERPPERLLNPDDPRVLDADDMPMYLQAMLRETGQPPAETRSDFVRLCLDSMVLSHRQAIRRLRELTGRRYSVIHVVGWGSGVQYFTQCLADATGLTVKAGPVEAKAVGNILLQLMALGDVASLAEARALVRDSFGTVTFEPTGDADRWDEAGERFASLG
ncbi:MAG: rhamnulokinase [Planctomycetes bacterium]|nr:rhamnulokinase [Planctomycetota bacterium]